MSVVTEKRATVGGGTGLDGAWKVIVLNDNHNTFEGVALALSQYVPGVDFPQGLQYAEVIHSEGRAVVWSGMREPAELYHQQLESCGLSMAALEN
jgi:ATP-dependent Clp protease adaptor protein ClpS